METKVTKLVVPFLIIISSFFIFESCSRPKVIDALRDEKNDRDNGVNTLKSKGDILDWGRVRYESIGDTISFNNEKYDIFSMCVYEGFGFISQRFFLFTKSQKSSEWQFLLERGTDSKNVSLSLIEGDLVYKTKSDLVLMSIPLRNIGVH